MVAEKSTDALVISQLRGDFVSLLAQVEDEELLREMLRRCMEAMQAVDMLEDLPKEVIQALEAAVADDDESDTISNEEAFETFKTWAKK